MSDCLKPETNQTDILVMQLKREIEKHKQDTTAQLLIHDGKIAKLCAYLKENLSSELQLLLDSMLNSGELDKIITTIIASDIQTLQRQTEFEIDPDHSTSYTDDYKKLQEAFDTVCELFQKGVRSVVKLNRMYNITGHSIVVNKAVDRNKLIVTGCAGGITKNDSGFMFVKGDVDYVTDIEFRDVVMVSSANASVLKSPDFINVTFTNCRIEGISTIVDSETYMQNIHCDRCLITGGDGDLFTAAGYYGLFIKGCTIEHRKGFVVKQKNYDDVVTSYNKAFFVDVVDNLIEGFMSGGIASLYRVYKVNISNNYFENMCDNIVYSGTLTFGAMTIFGNRLFVGGTQSQFDKTGLLNLKTNMYPSIDLSNNLVENNYLFHLSNGYCSAVKIKDQSNCVRNGIKTTFLQNGAPNNPHTNVFPFMESEYDNTLNKYSRTIVLVSDVEYSHRFNVDGGETTLYLFNGVMKAALQKTVALVSDINTLQFALGVPHHCEDITSVQAFGSVDVTNVYRAGLGNSKTVTVRVNNPGVATNIIFCVQAILNMSSRG